MIIWLYNISRVNNDRFLKCWVLGKTQCTPSKLTCTLKSDNASKHKLSSDLRFTSCSTKLLGNPWNSKGRRLLPPVNASKVNLIKLNKYLSKYKHILLKQIGKGIFRKKTPNSPDWCSIHPTLVATLCSSLSGGKHVHPYLQWSVFFVSLLTVVSCFYLPNPPEVHSPRKPTAGTWKYPLGKRRNISKPPTPFFYHPWYPSSL